MDAKKANRRWLTAVDFEQFVADESGEPEHGRCTGCGREGKVWPQRRGADCEPCLRALHAYDRAEEVMVRAILAGAVAAAIHAGASEELIHAAVADALAERVRVEITP